MINVSREDKAKSMQQQMQLRNLNLVEQKPDSFFHQKKAFFSSRTIHHLLVCTFISSFLRDRQLVNPLLDIEISASLLLAVCDIFGS